MTEIYSKIFGLIRHGETDWNIDRRMQGQEDIPLNKTGIRQAGELSRQIARSGQNWDLIVSSPLARALDTAKMIQQVAGHGPLILLDQFKERDFGQASGLTRQQVHERFPDGQIPGLESADHLTTRVTDGLRHLFVEHTADRILLVTHGEVLRTIYRLIGQPHKVAGKPANASLDIVEIRKDFLS